MDVAHGAHRLEVEVQGLESGIQDQLSSAFGGINYLEIDSYPKATVRRMPDWEELSDLLTLVFVGRAHDSSGVHRQVIDHLAAFDARELGRLRDAAVAARDAVLARDLDAFGEAMIANTEGQQALHADLVGADARRIIGFAARQGAAGWKVNGAGGDGGSVTILSFSREAKDALESGVGNVDPGYRVLPVEISSTGLDVRRSL
jgi:D-glycero-alpha-D-manno-heptose-7-phosphate kinase